MNLKDKLYFPFARYFRFWAKIALKRWKPYIIVVTGSSGKTTMLNLIDSQIGEHSKVSHHANSTYGIPFNILNLDKITSVQGVFGWLKAFFLSPIKAFTVNYSKKYYVAEADADRPGEGEFLADLLKPDITIWVSLSRTHAMRYDRLSKITGIEVEQLITEEYSYLAHAANDAVIVDGDNKYIFEQLAGITNKSHAVSDLNIKEYKISQDSCEFTLQNGSVYKINGLLPPVAGKQIAMLDVLMEELETGVDNSFDNLKLPPGRSTVLKGKNGSTIIDSSYNSNLGSVSAMLDLFEEYPSNNKILVFGDMYEQGVNEGLEHEKLAKRILQSKDDFKQVVLFGKRNKKYTYPYLKKKGAKVVSFTDAKETIEYLNNHLKKEDAILVKGGGMMEGIVEGIVPKSEHKKLARRGSHWDRLRKAAGYY